MKKITLKCYRSERAETLLMQAANMIAARTKTDSLHVRNRTKSATIYVSEPLLALAAAKAIKRKTGVSIIIAGLPEGTAQFVGLLERRGLLEEWIENTCYFKNCAAIDWVKNIDNRNCWIGSAFPRGALWPWEADWPGVNREWVQIVEENNL